MIVLRLLVFCLCSMFFVPAYSESPAGLQAKPVVEQHQPATLGRFIEKYLMGYWVRIKDVSDTPVWFANLSATRYAHHRVYICGAGDDYVVLCYPTGAFYSAFPTTDVRLGGLYTDPWYAVDVCKAGYRCSPPKMPGQP